MNQILEDKTGVQRAKITVVEEKDNLVIGSIIQHSFTKEQIAVFEEYCEIVDNQIFSLLDKMEEQIESFGFKIKSEKREIFDVQVWNLQSISFRFKKSIHS
ncbi:MAG: hypothetical protein AB8B69_03785 [Chitinophagales bacterium]